MALQTQVEQAVKLVPTQAMQQSLNCLQMPVSELNEYLQEQALSNPFLDLEEPSAGINSDQIFSLEYRERDSWAVHSSDSDGDSDDIFNCISPQMSYTDYLNEQLGYIRELDDTMLALCRYIVGNLNSAGYLDSSIEEMSQHLGVSEFFMEQALYVVQDLEPAGTAARDLPECLILQLAKSDHFNETTLHLAKWGLPKLSKMDYSGLAKLLGVSVATAKDAAGIIRELNPIPSRGFYTDEKCAVIIPEAEISCENGEVSIELNRAAMPQLSLNPYYCSLVGNGEYESAQPYLWERLSSAKNVINAVMEREKTVHRILTNIVMLQPAFFLNSGELLPMTMQQMADRLDLNVSTVSRALRNKYVICNGSLLSLRSLFTSSVPSADGESVSSSRVKNELLRLLSTDDPQKPQSDYALSLALESSGIIISRRTVAKYRKSLGIASASERKKSYRPSG